MDLNSNNKLGRRDFIIKNLTFGTFLGIGCSGLQAMGIYSDSSSLSQDRHKFQSTIDYTYQRLFDFTFNSWFISYMKQLQKEIGKQKFLELLKKAGEEHYRGRVEANFKKINDKSVQSLIENFWEVT